MQLPALLNEEIGIDNAEEAAEIFKRSSMDALILDLNASSLFANNRDKVDHGAVITSEIGDSALASDLRRRSVTWLEANVKHDSNNASLQFTSGTARPPRLSFLRLTAFQNLFSLLRPVARSLPRNFPRNGSLAVIPLLRMLAAVGSCRLLRRSIIWKMFYSNHSTML